MKNGIPVGGSLWRLMICGLRGHRWVKTAGSHFVTCRRCAYTFPIGRKS